MKGFDLSFAIPSAQWWRDRRAEGYEVMFQDAWTGTRAPAGTHTNLARARAAGFDTNIYTVVNLHPGAFSVDKARAACGDEWEHVTKVAIDVEVKGISYAIYKDRIAKAEARIRALNKDPGVYTAHWFWVGHLGNPSDFKHLWIWPAFYDLDPDIDFASRPYGGWTLADVMGAQYTGTTDLDGKNVDLDTFVDSFFETGGLTVSEYTELKARMAKQEKLHVGNRSYRRRSGRVISLSSQLLFSHTKKLAKAQLNRVIAEANDLKARIDSGQSVP